MAGIRLRCSVNPGLVLGQSTQAQCLLGQGWPEHTRITNFIEINLDMLKDKTPDLFIFNHFNPAY